MGIAFTPGADFGGLSPQACCIGRPYLMEITDRVAGEPLFMARVTDPVQP
jgi:hypothetical protein